MLNTYNDSLISNQQLPEVEVLLATYNGEPYLREFLESLSQQKGVVIHLSVSDDGSTDKTLEVIRSFQLKFKTIQILNGPQKGPAENFLNLIKQAKTEIIALADQDDVWLPNHLYNSLCRIQSCSNGSAALSICKVKEFTSPEDFLTPWPNENFDLGFPKILYENVGRGCTMVFNKKMATVILQSDFKFAIMHDWWILLLATLYGEVSYTNEYEILYRIHSNNFIGNPKFTFRSLLIRAIKNKLGLPRYLQMISLSMQPIQQSKIDERSRELLGWLNLINSSFFKRIAVFKPEFVLRSNRFENHLLKITILFSTRKKTSNYRR
jgi:glycosyltransferase involved in cell wall biosynthesis